MSRNSLAAHSVRRDRRSNSAVSEIHGNGKVTGVTLKDTRSGETRHQPATGIFVGLRGALSLFGACVAAWAVTAPLLVRAHVVKDASYTSLVAWLVWPAFGMMLGGSVGPLIAGARRHGRVAWRVRLLGHATSVDPCLGLSLHTNV